MCVMYTEPTEASGWNPAAEVNPDIAKGWGLTPREKAVLGVLITSEGCTHDRMSMVLGISPHTFKNYVTNLLLKAEKGMGYPVTDADLLARGYLALEQVLSR